MAFRRASGIVLALILTGLSLTACATATSVVKSMHAAAPLKRAPTELPPPTTPHPFGRLTCGPEYGVRFCQGNGTTDRVPSFDGVPLDADVTLPAKGRGPFPLIVMLHGLASNKTEYETTRNDGGVDNVSFAARGWAVLTYTARGFGDSCGTAASRANTPACEKGWIHLADQRYEVRDTQYLAGMLVDEGLVKPTIAVTGLSYGGGQSLELAMLKNRMRLTDGKLVAWVSPKRHVPMSIGAAYAEWGWDDLVTSLVPNGDLLTDHYTSASADLAPVGVEKQSWDDLLYAATALFYLAPRGADANADLTEWHDELDAGEPYGKADGAGLKQLQEFHSAIGVSMPAGGPAPTVMQNGWTDTLFPVSEALHWAERYIADHVHPALLQIFDDVGHGWAQGKPADVALQTKRAIAFLDAEMITHKKPETGVIAVGTTCPKSAPSGPVVGSPSWSDLQKHTISVKSGPAQVVTSSGGSAEVASELNPAYSSPYCDSLPAAKEPGTATYTVVAKSAKAVQVIGPLRVNADLRVTGDYPELVGRLWDVDPATSSRQLVEAGVYRPTVNQAAGTKTSAVGNTKATFELSANFWTLPAGHELELELVGSTAPWFRASNGTFQIAVSHLTATIGRRT